MTKKVDLLTSALLPHSADILERAGAYQRQGDDEQGTERSRREGVIGISSDTRVDGGRGEYVASNYSALTSTHPESEEGSEGGEESEGEQEREGLGQQGGMQVHLASAGRPNPFRVFSSSRHSATNIPPYAQQTHNSASSDANFGVFDNRDTSELDEGVQGTTRREREFGVFGGLGGDDSLTGTSATDFLFS